MFEYEPESRVLALNVLVVPRASRTELKGEHDGALRIRIAAPPVEGAANEELVRFLAKCFGVPKSDIEIASGAASRRKTVRLKGISRQKAAEISASIVQ